jgi:hypothetical protein
MPKRPGTLRKKMRNAQTGAFGDRPGAVPPVTSQQFSAAIRRVRRMTVDQKVQSLIDAGILTKSGKRLAKPYRSSGD